MTIVELLQLDEVTDYIRVTCNSVDLWYSGDEWIVSNKEKRHRFKLKKQDDAVEVFLREADIGNNETG